MKATLGFRPKARREGIITKQVDGELLVYDLERDKAHCLNPTAALVWRLCDGHRNVNDLAQSLSETMGTPVDEIIIELALTQLTRGHLLSETHDFLPGAANLSRRALVRRLGVAAVLLPLITTITAPTALAGISDCIISGQACTEGGVPCCDAGTCSGGVCV